MLGTGTITASSYQLQEEEMWSYQSASTKEEAQVDVYDILPGYLGLWWHGKVAGEVLGIGS